MEEPEQICMMVSREKRHASELCQNSQASVAEAGAERDKDMSVLKTQRHSNQRIDSAHTVLQIQKHNGIVLGGFFLHICFTLTI